MWRLGRLFLFLVLAIAGTIPLAAGASATPGYCGLSWGSLPKAASAQNASPLVQVRTGRHACFDRVVFQVAGSVGAGYRVEYVPTVYQDGSGAPLAVPGGARLAVTLHHPAHDEAGEPTFFVPVGRQAANVAGYDTLRSVVWGGSFEGSSTFGVGTRARLPFRVFVLDGPGGDSRIVLDVAHRW